MGSISPTFKKIFSLDATIREKFEYVVCSFIGVFFTFMTFYTIAKTPYLISKYAPVITPLVLLYLVGFIAIMIFVQGITAYGFLYSKSWIKYIITLHAIAYIVYTVVILPAATALPFSKAVLLSASPYYVMAIVLWFFITLKKPTRHPLLIVFLYTVSIILTIAFQVTYNT